MIRRSHIALVPIVAALLLRAGDASAQARGAYLQMGTSTTMTVVWSTESAAASEVRYGAAPDDLTESVSVSAAVTQHEIEITGLEPSTRYYYSVGDGTNVLEGADADHWFETSPPPGAKTKFRAWIVGDSGTGELPQLRVKNAMLEYAKAYRPDIYLHMGDMAYNTGTTAEFTDNFFDPYAEVLRNTVIWPTMGNHEGGSSDSGTQTGPYYTAYVLPRAAEAGGVASGTEAYYSFDYANVHFIVLDSHDSPRQPGGAMLQWLQSDLDATNQDWVIAYFHHPPYTKGTHNSDTEGQLVDMRENALPILEAGGVDLVLAGHSHIYERSFLVDGGYETPTTAQGVIDPNDGMVLGDGPYTKSAGLTAHDGAVYIVAGHGGASLGGTADHPLMYFSEREWGSCLLDVQDNRLSIVNIREDGEVTDRFSLVKGTTALVIGTPDGGEALSPGSDVDIQWATVGSVPDVKLEYSLNDGETWTTIAASTPNTGSHMWTVPNAGTLHGLIRVSSVANPAVLDESNAGFSIENAPIDIVPNGAEWLYHDLGVDLGPTWMDPGFDETGWKQGPAQLGYGEGDEATVLVEGDPHYPSAYFRKHVTLDFPVTAADLEVLHDDGVAVFVNGTPVFAQYMDNGIEYGAFASAPADEPEISVAPIALSPNPFVVGDNVIAAIVKQVEPGSSDISFDMKMTVTLDLPDPPATGGGGMGGSGNGAGEPSGSGGNGGSGNGGGGSADSDSDDGCGCSTTNRGGGGTVAVLGVLALLLARGSKRR